MKTELKTLKDLEQGFSGHLNKYARCDELKSEAIKDYKDDTQMYPHIFNTIEQQEAVRRYIKWKNNLTEEDLKEEGSKF